MRFEAVTRPRIETLPVLFRERAVNAVWPAKLRESAGNERDESRWFYVREHAERHSWLSFRFRTHSPKFFISIMSADLVYR